MRRTSCSRFLHRIAALVVIVVSGALAGCGPTPDLKIQVSQIPNDTTQLWLVAWQGEDAQLAVVNESLIYDLVPASGDGMRGYSLGLQIEDRSKLVRLSVAAFRKGTLGYCFRTSGTAVQPPNYGSLTALTLIMNERQHNDHVDTCYPSLESQKRPMITSLGLAIERLVGGELGGVVVISGWNFSPKATLALDDAAGPLPLSAGEPMRDRPDQLLVGGTVPRAQALQGGTLVVTVTNPDGQTAKYPNK